MNSANGKKKNAKQTNKQKNHPTTNTQTAKSQKYLEITDFIEAH